MSAKNNVNKDHYTQAGRDRADTNIVHDDQKEAMTQAEKRIATGEAAAPKGNRPKVQPGATDDRTIQVPEGMAEEALRRQEDQDEE